jgi:hypothetical protein
MADCLARMEKTVFSGNLYQCIEDKQTMPT